jgi:hypothetical protein
MAMCIQNTARHIQDSRSQVEGMEAYYQLSTTASLQHLSSSGSAARNEGSFSFSSCCRHERCTKSPRKDTIQSCWLCGC